MNARASGSRRRAGLALMLLLGAALLPAAAQASKGPPRIGILSYFAMPTAASPDPAEAGVRQGLRELGYVEGQNIFIERRYADGRPDRLAAMAEELVRLQVDVILAGGQPPREAARKATHTIPIVTLSGSDPVREGWAQSLARPGGNVTGLTFTFPEIGAKRLELLKEASPGLSRVAMLVDPIELVDAKDVVRETEAGARRLGLQLQVLETHGQGDLDAAFELARARPGAGDPRVRRLAEPIAGRRACLESTTSCRWARGRKKCRQASCSATARTSTTWFAAPSC